MPGDSVDNWMFFNRLEAGVLIARRELEQSHARLFRGLPTPYALQQI